MEPAVPAPETIEKLTGKAHDLDAARKSVEDAASISTSLWLSYLFVLLYLGVAVGAVTHKDLLLENPVKLPFLGDVTLPLVAFFVLAPVIFIVSHAYTLVHLVILAAKASVFDTELRAQAGDAPGTKETRERLRRQLPSNIFVQILAGPADIRGGGLGLLLKAIAWGSLVIGPVLLLLLIQVRFLAYHLEWVTWVHRLALVADLMLLWALWPAMAGNQSKLDWSRPWRHKILAAASVAAIGLAFTEATFPGESMENWMGDGKWIPLTIRPWLEQTNDKAWTSVHDLLLNGDYDEKHQGRKSPFSNTLLLPKFSALEAGKIDEEKLAAAEQSLTRKGKHFERALLRGADLRKANLENAFLQGADLYQAKLQNAVLYNAELQGASLFQANLQRASLDSAHLQGANLFQAKLQGASLFNTNLQGAALEQAQLQGAWLRSAGLPGAPPEGAHLEAARLDGAYLQGASLEGAHLEGASLNGAHLQGASLKGAHLEGASLNGAHLQGASLEGAHLQGAWFINSIFDRTNMRNAEVWRTRFEHATLTAVIADGVKETGLPQDWIAAVKESFMKDVPAGGQRDQALERIAMLNPGIPDKETDPQVPEAERGDDNAYRDALAAELKSIACSGDGAALDIVRELVGNGRIKDTEAQASKLVNEIIQQDCPVAAVLTDRDKANLRAEAKQTQASGSKQ